MPRNPKLDLAKRQAVGVFKPVPRFAPKAEGDFRPVEAGKPCFTAPKPQPAVLDGVKVRYIPTGKVTTKEGRCALRPEYRRGGATPQMRATMDLYGVRQNTRTQKAIIGWDSYVMGESRLIARSA